MYTGMQASGQPILKTCLKCGKSFDSCRKLEQHKRDTGHNYQVSESKQRLAYVNEYHKNYATLDEKQVKDAVRHVREIVGGIMDNVRKQDGGSIYGNEVRNAGSFSTNTKIGKPDEFDLNVPLEFRGRKFDTILSGKVPYRVKITEQGNRASNLNVKVSVSSEFSSTIEKNRALIKLHNHDQRFSHVSHNGYVIPRLVKEDLYEKIKQAITNEGLRGKVDLSRDAHGPAITLTIKDHSYHISIDIAATVESPDIPNLLNGFPRPETCQRVPMKAINAVLDAGGHLVAKGDETWHISTSKAERGLLTNIDDDNGCRRSVHKMMKADLLKWTSKSQNGLPGISTHVLKNQLLWMNEKKKGAGADYWKQGNMDKCYMDALKDLEQKCRRREILKYFDPKENVLAGKDKNILDELANFAKRRYDELANLSQ